MKKLLILILTIQLIAFSCEREDVLDKEPNFSELNGEWNWTSTCGGITGQCGYPSQGNTKTIQITESRFIERNNGVTSLDTEYKLKNKLKEEFYTSYEIELNNGQTWRMTSRQDTLNIEKGDFWDSYKRLTN